MKKKFIGFSDTTVLLNAIYQKTGVSTYLGPAFVSFCNPHIPEETINSFIDVLIKEKTEIKYGTTSCFAYDDWFLKNKNEPRDFVKYNGFEFIQEGKAKGKLIGGNCQSLIKLIGTDFFPNVEGCVLLIEDVPNKNPAELLCELEQLKNMGVFKKIDGFILGQFGYNNQFYKSVEYFNSIKRLCEKKDIPIEIRRVYYISGIHKGAKRGFHAHKRLKQLLFCPYGKINILLDDGSVKKNVLLSDSSLGLLIDEPIWREITWIKSNSVLCVVASEFYSEDDYIRNYDNFISYRKNNSEE